jgi:Domain of unknown function (DUF4276)
MNNPAYLVEGDLEQKFIQNVCQGAPVQKINCNGDETSLDAIAKRVGSLGRLLHKRHTPIIVIFDREGRKEESEDIELQFREKLKSENLNVPVIIGVPDRNIETWILADPEQFSASANVSNVSDQCRFEGKCGKANIKKLLKNKATYVETIDGVKWLKSSRPNEIQKNSPSFRRFAAALAKLNCWWLKELHLSLNTEP